MLVSECCHHVLMTTEPDQTLLDAAGRMHCYQIGALPVYQQHRLIGMAELGVRHLPVVEGNHLVGMLSMRDLMAGPAATPTPTDPSAAA